MKWTSSHCCGTRRCGHFRSHTPQCRLLFILLAAILLPACSQPLQSVTVFHAESLSPLIGEATHRFQQNHPGVNIVTESSGSLDAIRKVTELGRPCDVIAVSDHRLIERFLAARVGPSYIFLGNEMVLATARSEGFGDDPSQKEWMENWYERLSRGRYSYGITDLNGDPEGYYAHLSWKLAEVYYNRSGLYRRLLNGLKPSWVLPGSSELLALLENGALDFAFLYKSTALQENLDFVTFPTEVSLAEDTYANLYSRVFVHVAEQRPGTPFEITGTPIRYGIALTSQSNPLAGRLLDFLLSPAMQELYRALGYLNVPILEVQPSAQ